MTLRPSRAARSQILQRGRDRLRVALRAPGLEPLDLLGFGLVRHGEDRAVGRGERRGLALGEPVDADHDLLAALDRLEPRVLDSTSCDFM